MTLSDLGRAQRVVVDAENTTIIGAPGDESATEGRPKDPRQRRAEVPEDLGARLLIAVYS